MERFSKLAYALAGSTVAATALAYVASGTYAVDSLHSNIGFSVPIAGGLSHMQGKFNKFSATIDYDPSNPGRSSVKATIDVNSLNTGVPGRDKHTLGLDGFYAERYPTITFVSKRVEKIDNGFKCTGDLTMRGIKKEIAIQFHQTGTRSAGEGVKLIGFEGGFKMNRRDYGLKWEMPHAADWIGDNVEVQISVIARPR